MAKKTTNLELPYPDSTDSDNVPKDIKALAEALDVLKWGSASLKPTAGVKLVSALLTLTTSYQDIPGLSVSLSPTVASRLLVTLATTRSSGGGSLPFVAVVKVDEEAEKDVLYSPTEAGGSETRSGVIEIPLTAGAHTVKVRAKTLTGEGTGHAVFAKEGTTRMLYELFAS